MAKKEIVSCKRAWECCLQ